MRKRYEPRYDWTWQAAKHIRHPLDRPAVMRELDDHIEDMVEAYMEAGLSLEEARNKAIASMGDPDETGQALAKVHTPWLSLLLTSSMSLFLLTLLLAFQLLQSGRIVDHWYSIKNTMTAQEIANMKKAEAVQCESEDIYDIAPAILWSGQGYTFTLGDGYIHSDSPMGIIRLEISYKKLFFKPNPIGVLNELRFYDVDGNILDHTYYFIDRNTLVYTIRLTDSIQEAILRYDFGQVSFVHTLKGVTP